MQNKIALEEHWETSEFTNPLYRRLKEQVYLKDYLDGTTWRLADVDRRVEDNLANGIELSVISISVPGVEGLTDAGEAVDMARRVNDRAAEFVARHPGTSARLPLCRWRILSGPRMSWSAPCTSWGASAPSSTAIPTSAT